MPMLYVGRPRQLPSGGLPFPQQYGGQNGMLGYTPGASAAGRRRPTTGIDPRTGGRIQGPNAGRRLPRTLYGPRNINGPNPPARPYAPTLITDFAGPVGSGMGYGSGTGFGFPVGSGSFKPSKFSGGFSSQLRQNILNQRTGSMRDIDDRRFAGQNAAIAAANAAAGPRQPRRSASVRMPDGSVGNFSGAGGGFRVAPTPGWTPPPGDARRPEASGQAYPDEMLNFFEAMQRAENSANAKNEQRYDEILGGYRQRRDEAMQEMASLGTTQRREIDDLHTRAEAELEQDMIARGLGNTTLRSSARADLGERRGRLRQELEERLTRNRIDLGAQLSGDMLGFMERRTDEGPDVRLSTLLAGQLGETGFGDDWGGTYGGAGRQIPYEPGMPVTPQPLYPPNGGIAPPVGGFPAVPGGPPMGRPGRPFRPRRPPLLF